MLSLRNEIREVHYFKMLVNMCLCNHEKVEKKFIDAERQGT